MMRTPCSNVKVSVPYDDKKYFTAEVSLVLTSSR